MRKYSPKDDVQKKSTYSDRFFVSPNNPKLEPQTDEIFKSDYEEILKYFDIKSAYIEHTHLVLNIDKNDILKIMDILKNTLTYDVLIELSAIDYIAKENCFEVFYELLSMSKHKRIRVKTKLIQDENIESITSLFKSANWSEREMYDMFGIQILNHPNLKRLLMPDDWYDHPLKKTYPLQGDEAASWYEIDKIFGKSARDTIGPEQRDSAAIDRYDTTRFARLGHEVPFGMDINEFEPETKVKYQEDDVSAIMKKLKPEDSVVLKRRK